MPVPDRSLLDPQQTAVYLNVKVARVYELVASKRLRARKVGRLLRFRPEDVEEFLERNSTVREGAR